MKKSHAFAHLIDFNRILFSRIIFVFFVLLSLFFVLTTVYAQTENLPENAPYDELSDLTFPISELGNCASAGECMSHCDDPVNNATCIDYAKTHGFYEDDPLLASADEFWKDAEDVLGCNSGESCFDFCSQDVNLEQCDLFAKDHDMPIGGFLQGPFKPEFLEIARQVLGCDSTSSCKNFCDDPANIDSCGDFAHRVGLLGGQTTIGPGGCTTPETCGNFCQDPNNFSSCSVFAPGGGFTGPGGCSDPVSCRTFCEENPLDCRSYAPGSNGVYVPVACSSGQYFGPGGVCTSEDKTAEAGQCATGGKFWNGSSCQDTAPSGIHPQVGGAFFQPRPEMGNCETPGECYDYCKANPGRCGGFDSSSSRPPDTYIPYVYYTPGTEVKFEAKTEYGNCDSPGSCYDYCKSNPGQCQGFDSSAPRPLDTYVPGTYYTPPTEYTYFTPPSTTYYVTPIYYTPPSGSNYTTPSYYTPGSYYTPSYYTPYSGTSYTTPTYYTPGTYYVTPSGEYPTPQYLTPYYYTPPEGSNYTTPSYYTPPTYTSPYYYTPPEGNTYTSPTYYTPSGYTYPTPSEGYSYPSPTYYTPTEGGYSYPSPSYGTPEYPTPSYSYPSPSYGTPEYPTPSYSYPSPVQGASAARSIWQIIIDFLFKR